MELRQLRHFIAVAETENMRRASESIHLSHPALSLSIKKLEESLEVALFERSAKGVKLTEAGRLLLDFAYSILNQVDNARSTVKSAYSNPSGVVKLGCTPGVRNVLSVPMYKQVRAKYPNITVEVDDSLTPVLERLFEAGLLDLMIDFDIADQETFYCEPLISEELFLVGPSESNGPNTGEIPFSELDRYPIIANRDESSIFLTYEKYAGETGVQLQYQPGLGSALGEMALAENGFGYVIIPWSLVFNRLDNTGLCARRIVEPVMRRTAYLMSPLNRPLSRASLAVREVIKLAVKEVHEQGHWRGQLLTDSQ